jgi:type I restriction enzyme M protein
MPDKTLERDELHRAIWAIADELRGAVDGWDFKNYVLGTMFYRYISENLASSGAYLHREREEGHPGDRRLHPQQGYGRGVRA